MDWSQLLATFIGGVLALSGGALAPYVSARLEDERRREDQRSEFQRVTLLAVQDACIQLRDEAGNALSLDAQYIRLNTEIGDRALFEDNPETFEFEALAQARQTSLQRSIPDIQQRVSVLRTRLLDEGLRDRIRKLRRDCGYAVTEGLSSNSGDGWDVLERVSDELLPEIHDRIGELLREKYL